MAVKKNDKDIGDFKSSNKSINYSKIPEPQDVEDQGQIVETKLYKRRWLILMIFVLYAASSFMQWFQYSIISNLVEKYYSVSSWAVKLTSMIFMLTYLPLAFPVSYFMDKLDLRISALIGVTGTAVGSWVKVFSVAPTRFPVTFAGQTIIALSQLFIINVPPKLAAVWFGESEVSTACSIAIWGSQFGIASGFFLSPLLVADSSFDSIGSDLYNMFLYIAIFATVMTVAVIAVFQAKPAVPPSHAQAILILAPEKNPSYLHSLKKLLLNRDFIFLFTSNGINNGCFSAMSTMLNQIFSYYSPVSHRDDDIHYCYFRGVDDLIHPGTVGVIIVVGGMIGSVVCGAIMDKTKKYKEVAVAVYFLAAVTMVGYAFAAMSPNKVLIYGLAWILGFFLLGYTPVGYELASELTYPESEVTVATILNTMNMLAGILFTVIFDFTLEWYGEFWSNIAAAVTLVVGTALTVMIRPNLKRQQAQKIRSNTIGLRDIIDE